VGGVTSFVSKGGEFATVLLGLLVHNNNNNDVAFDSIFGHVWITDSQGDFVFGLL